MTRKLNRANASMKARSISESIYKMIAQHPPEDNEAAWLILVCQVETALARVRREIDTPKLATDLVRIRTAKNLAARNLKKRQRARVREIEEASLPTKGKKARTRAKVVKVG